MPAWPCPLRRGVHTCTASSYRGLAHPATVLSHSHTCTFESPEICSISSSINPRSALARRLDRMMEDWQHAQADVTCSCGMHACQGAARSAAHACVSGT
eukprot:1042965-Prymnesium_polylepis.1